MHTDEFRNQMDRLVATYGANKYPAERKAAFFKVFGSMEARDFQRVITRVIATDIHAPMIERLKEIRDVVGIHSGASVLRCALCEGSGWVIPDRLDVEPIAMRCNCVGGSKQLADQIRTDPKNPDPRLADRIERTFRNVDPHTYKCMGLPEDLPQQRTPQARPEKPIQDLARESTKSWS